MTSTEPRIVDEPTFVPEQTYTRYIDQYLEAVRDIDGVTAVYQMGGVSTPGISDIDLIVVVDGNFRPHRYNQLSVRRIFEDDEQAEYLFTHDVMILDEASFERLEYIFFASNLRLLEGDECSVESPSDEEMRHLRFAILCDIGLMRLHQFCGAELANVLPLRSSFLRASSIKHSLRLARPFEWNGLPVHLTSRVNDVRSRWFAEESAASARELFDACASAFRDIIHACADYFREAVLHFNDRRFRDNVLLLSDYGRVTLFLDDSLLQQTDNPAGRRKRNQAFRFLADNDSTLVAYPEHLYFHYLAYARAGQNAVTRLLNQALSSAHVNFSVDASYQSTMQKRTEAMSAHARFLQENRLFFSAGVGYPGINLRAYSL